MLHQMADFQVVFASWLVQEDRHSIFSAAKLAKFDFTWACYPRP
jgi:hypothetical protein